MQTGQGMAIFTAMMENEQAGPLSAAELSVLCDHDALRHRRAALEKLEARMRMLREAIAKEPATERFRDIMGEVFEARERESEAEDSRPFAAFSIAQGKMNRGEHYRGVPWRALDFPAFFDKQDFFFFRTTLLFGREFGFHLLFKGRFRDAAIGCISLDGIRELPEGTLFSAQEDAFRWGRDEGPYYLPQEVGIHNLLDHDILKISRFLPLREYERLVPFGLETWRAYAGLLNGA